MSRRSESSITNRAAAAVGRDRDALIIGSKRVSDPEDVTSR